MFVKKEKEKKERKKVEGKKGQLLNNKKMIITKYNDAFSELEQNS